MKLLTKLLFLFAITAMVSTGCKKDGEDSTPDQTTQAVGNYLGTYEEGSTGASLEFEDVEVEVTKTSNSEISIKMIVIPVIAVTTFSATMDSETTFTIPESSLPDQNVQGSGSIVNDNTIEIELTGVDDPSYKITYSGMRQ